MKEWLEEERRKKEAKEREEKERLKYQREFEEYRKKILKIKGKIEKEKLIKNTNLRKSGF